MEKKILIAAEGRTIHMPDGSLWPKEGLEDPDVLFTRRRVLDGDLIVKPADDPVYPAPELPAPPPAPIAAPDPVVEPVIVQAPKKKSKLEI